MSSRWIKEELIVALDLYLEIDFAGDPVSSSPRFAELAATLNRLPMRNGKPRDENGIRDKLVDFRRFETDPKRHRQGAGSDLDRVVWDQFANQPKRRRAEVEAILSAIVAPTDIAQTTRAAVKSGSSQNFASQLELVESAEDIQSSMVAFNAEYRRLPEVVASLLRTTSYWVYDPSSGTFGPSKFVGYRDMTLARYERARERSPGGDPFDGHATRKRIEQVIARRYEPNRVLAEQLQQWGYSKCPEQDVFANIKPSKWRFVQVSPTLESFALALGTESATAERNSSRAQGFNLSPEQRRAIEVYSMELAKAHFENDNWTVDDRVASTECYDLVCTRGSESLRVEVKGTTGLGQRVILTANEVEHAEAHFPRIALAVVHGIELNREAAKASGGKLQVSNPWRLKREKLKPVSFVYTCPD